MITLSPIVHHNQPRIRVDFAYSSALIEKIKKIPGRTFSKSLHTWHVPDNEDSARLLRELFGCSTPETQPAPKPPEATKTAPTSPGPIQPPAFPKNGGIAVVKGNPVSQKSGVGLLVDEKWIRVFLDPYPSTADINEIKSCRFSRWNYREKNWMVPRFGQNLNRLRKYFGDRIVSFEVRENEATGNAQPENDDRQRQAGIVLPVNEPFLKQNEEQMILKGMSRSTRRTYRSELGRFLADIKHIPATDFSHDRLRKYLAWCLETLGLSENTIHSRMNALKFFYEQVLHREKFFYDIPRPKRPMLLPKLLNEDELGRLFAALRNKKHKAILFTVYSSGLRVSEVVNLKLADIDSGRMQIHIRHAKGKKDRYVNLSPLLLDILRDYVKTSAPKPKEYLFESEQTGKPYPIRSVQQIFSNAKSKARILKEVGIHSLRHSFATHLLDKGTDIRYIKDLLGHFNIKTTERYLHVSKHQLVNIISPLDDLYQKGKINTALGDESKK